jgi:hypothetical protein
MSMSWAAASLGGTYHDKRHDLRLTAHHLPLLQLAVPLCADGPVRTLAGLSLVPGHRRGHGAPYDSVNHGRIDITRLRRALAACRCRGPPTAG